MTILNAPISTSVIQTVGKLLFTVNGGGLKGVNDPSIKNVWKDQMDFQHENPPLGSDIAIKVAPLEQFYW